MNVMGAQCLHGYAWFTPCNTGIMSKMYGWLEKRLDIQAIAVRTAPHDRDANNACGMD